MRSRAIGIHADPLPLLSKVSGGQAQRAAVARALIHQPAVVFADEPTGALDQASGELVLDELLAAARDQQTAVVLVTHELSVAIAPAFESLRFAGFDRFPGGFRVGPLAVVVT